MESFPFFSSVIETHPTSQVAAAGNIQAYVVGGTGPAKWGIRMKEQILDPLIDEQFHVPLSPTPRKAQCAMGNT
jgi:hypothetical protein